MLKLILVCLRFTKRLSAQSCAEKCARHSSSSPSPKQGNGNFAVEYGKNIIERERFVDGLNNEWRLKWNNPRNRFPIKLRNWSSVHFSSPFNYAHVTLKINTKTDRKFTINCTAINKKNSPNESENREKHKSRTEWDERSLGWWKAIRNWKQERLEKFNWCICFCNKYFAVITTKLSIYSLSANMIAADDPFCDDLFVAVDAEARHANMM